MTTIAYRDGVMAADTASWDSCGIFFGRSRKIYRLADGRVLGTAGSKSMALRVVAWLNGSADRPTPNDERPTDRFAGIIADCDGRIFYMDASLEPSELLDCKFTAIGSGRELALGAMAMGASASDACCIAAKFDQGTRLPIDIEFLNPDI